MVEREKIKLILTRIPGIENSRYALVWGVSGWCLWVSDGVWIISRGVRQMSGGV